MSNSALVVYTKLSPNRSSPRNHAIDTVTVHCVVGQCSVETIGAIFAPSSSRKSSNYGIGFDGKIALFVDEKNASWCSSNEKNDNRAITIECACDLKAPYAINANVYKSLINLCVDVCKRNNISKMLWKADKRLIGIVDKQNMTVHRWFFNKSCPGDYIYNRLGIIAEEVNAQLEKEPVTEILAPAPVKKSIDDIANEVLKGLWGSGADRKARITKAGYNYAEVQKRINAKLIPVPVKKSVDTIAHEVLKGLWGSGADRKARITKAGYNYTEVQKRVNDLL